MPKRGDPPPPRKSINDPTCPGGPKASDFEHGSPRPSSPFAALVPRRARFSSVPLVELRHPELDDVTLPASVELPRRHVNFFLDSESESSFSTGGLCSMSDTMESFKDVGGSPCSQPSVRIKHLTRNSDGGSRFPKLDECAHFHYDNVELGPLSVSLCEDRHDAMKSGVESSGDFWFWLQVASNGRSWDLRRSLENFQMLDRQLHRCVYDRKFSLLKELALIDYQDQTDVDAVRIMLTEYLERFSQLAGSLINCGPVLNWLELDNRGNRLIVTDEAAINTPAVAAAYVVKRYAWQAADEISLEVGDIISVIDMPPPDESTWWRGKKGFQVGFFPCECVEIIGDKVPQTIKIPKVSAKPVLRKHGKLIAFFRQFLLSRPSRRKLKQSGILKERVFGCDLGEHLMNTGRDIPMVLKCCAEFIEEHGIVDGIYRLSGVTSNIQKLRLAFDEDRVPNLMDEAILQDIHCVASLLKMYFRELPNPLLTFHLYDKFVNAVQAEEETRLLRLRDVVQQLPPPHYRSLEYLMRHLSKVAGYGSQTGMTPKNVAIVWAPNLLRSRDVEGGGVGALHVVGVQAILTEYLIRYTDIIFSEKMPIFPSTGLGEETPKKTRPKSLAISTPTKLLSLEEARSRALTSNLPTDQQKFIEVGGGVENLPTKYHTIIELPAGRRGLAKGKKSPSGWKSFFSRGWHSSSGRRKSRGSSRAEARVQSPKIIGPLLDSPIALQDKAVTEADVSHTNPKKLRTVKSAESLMSTKATGFVCHHLEVIESFSPLEESTTSSHQTSFEYTPLQEGLTSPASPSKSPCYQKHIRSTSHDSYFEHVVELSREEDDIEMDYDEDKSCQDDLRSDQPCTISVRPKTVVIMVGDDIFKHMELKRDVEGSPSNRMKVAQKQKLVSFDSEASSPKLQKLSLKRLYQTPSSPPMVRKRDNKSSNMIEDDDADETHEKCVDDSKLSQEEEEDETSDRIALLSDISHPILVCDRKMYTEHSEKVGEVSNHMISSRSNSSVESHSADYSTNIMQASSSVPLQEHVPQNKLFPERGSTLVSMPHPEEMVFAEIHATLEHSVDVVPLGHQISIDTDKSEDTADYEADHLPELRDSRDALRSLSMEATLSDTLSISQLMSYDSKECGLFSPSVGKEEKVSQDLFCPAPLDSSLVTPDSPTMDNVSDMPSSAGSEISCSPGDGEKDKLISASGSFDKLSPGLDSKEQSQLLENISGPRKSESSGTFPQEQGSFLPLTNLSEKKDQVTSTVQELSQSSCSQTPTVSSFDHGTDISVKLHPKADEMLAEKARTLKIGSSILKSDETGATADDLSAGLIRDAIASPSNVNGNLQNGEALLLDSIDENIILSPPENFVDHKDTKETEKEQKLECLLNSDLILRKTTSDNSAQKMQEKSMTVIHGICPKFVSGISVSGSFGHQISPHNQDQSKKRNCSERLSPISPVEESRRRFESEIGRLIVRERQMRLEMEQMQAERQKYQQKQESITPEKSIPHAKVEKKFADIIELQKSPSKHSSDLSSGFEKKKNSDPDDLLKTTKDGAELKRLPDPCSTNVYPRFLKGDKKPSIKELLSKFETPPNDTTCVSTKRSTDILDSTPKQKTGVFSNVQVINHNFPQPRDFISGSSESHFCPDESQSAQLREHIFQTECVVRFPHPKASSMISKSSTPKADSSSLFEADSQSKDALSRSMHFDPPRKFTNPRAVFLSSDNLLNSVMTTSDILKPSSGFSDITGSFVNSPDGSTKERFRRRLGSQPEGWEGLNRLKGDKHDQLKEKLLLCEKSFNQAKESQNNGFHSQTFQKETTDSLTSDKKLPSRCDSLRESKPSVKLKDEFFASFTQGQELHAMGSHDFKDSNNMPQESAHSKQSNLLYSTRTSLDNGAVLKKSPLRSERTLRRHSPIKERPKSVPPPICRLSVTASKHPKAMHVTLPTTDTEIFDRSKNSVPKSPTSASGDREIAQVDSEASQKQRGPPKRVRDRAAMFERSLSFSGCVGSPNVLMSPQSNAALGTKSRTSHCS